MRFFTLQWWCGNQQFGPESDPVGPYFTHLERIRDRLPPGLLQLQDSVSLHDGKVRELELCTHNGILSLVVDGDDGTGGFRRFILRYSGVSLFRSTADPEVGLLGPHGYGDWGYDELDLVEAGEIEHRILFSSGIEMAVRFTAFELTWQDQV